MCIAFFLLFLSANEHLYLKKEHRMKRISMNRRQLRRFLVDCLGICIGCFLVAVGFVLFINPYKLVPGGVFGTSIVLHQLFPQIQVGTFGYILEVPILLLSAFCLGAKLGAKTLLASFAAPLFMNLISSWCYPTEEALQALDPQQLLGGMLNFSDDLILAILFGPLLIALGTGLIIKSKASSGGSDVIAMIISRYARVKFSNALLAVDGTVVMMGLLVIGLGLGNEGESATRSLKLSGYSLLCIYMVTRVLAFVISGAKNDKIMLVVTPGNTQPLRDFILHDLDRTATCLPGYGLYSGEKREMLMLVLHQKEVDYVTTRIKRFCPEVFIVMTDAYDTYGLRWSDLPQQGDLVLK